MGAEDGSDRDMGTPKRRGARGQRGVSDIQRWCKIWEELFPGVNPPAPRLAYIGSPLEEAALIFQTFWMTHEEEVLKSVLGMNGSSQIQCGESSEGHGYTREAMTKMVESIVNQVPRQAQEDLGKSGFGYSDVKTDYEPKMMARVNGTGCQTIANSDMVDSLDHWRWQNSGVENGSLIVEGDTWLAPSYFLT